MSEKPQRRHDEHGEPTSEQAFAQGETASRRMVSLDANPYRRTLWDNAQDLETAWACGWHAEEHRKLAAALKGER